MKVRIASRFLDGDEWVLAEAIDVAPLPSGVDAILLMLYESQWGCLSIVRRQRLRSMAEDYSAHVRRDVTWRRTLGLFWCGPIARGGALHRALYDALPKRTRSKIIAWDMATLRSTYAWPPTQEPTAPPLDEDDDDNALTEVCA